MVRAILLLPRDRRGNVLALTAFALIPLLFALSFGIDYARAMKLQTRMNAAADAAALTVVSTPMMQQTTATAQAAAKATFVAQVTGLAGLTFNASNDLTITVTTSGSLNNGRTVTVTWRGQSANVFSPFLKTANLPISGGATAAAVRAPNINFYVALDVSPSMLLPSTSAGLTAIRAATATSYNTNGCDFACHTQNPHSDNIYVRNTAGLDIWLDSSGKAWAVNRIQSNNVYANNSSGQEVNAGAVSSGQYADGYWLTRNYASLYGGSTTIPLRIDEEQAAAQNLIPVAVASANSNNVTYKMQFFKYDWTHAAAASPVTTINTMTNVNSLSSYTVPDFYASQDNWYRNNCPTSSLCISDMGTETANMLTAMNTTMPAPGDGSTAASPQEVLFVITDGVSDETYSSTRWNREFNPTDLTACTTIKNRGIRIAILYTKYLPEALTGDSWSQSNVAPYLTNVAPALQSCASTQSGGSPLYYEVTTDQSISDALAALFRLTVQTAHLTK
jgi:Flp pilus assembly protein TadG